MCHSILPTYEDTFFHTCLDTLIGIKHFRVNLNQSDPNLALQPPYAGGKPYEFFIEPNRISIRAPLKDQDIEFVLPCRDHYMKLSKSPVFRSVRAGMHIYPIEQSLRTLPVEAFLARFSPATVAFFDGRDVSVSTLSLSVLDPELFADQFRNLVELHNDKVKVLLHSFGLEEE